MGKKKVTVHKTDGSVTTVFVNSDAEARSYEEATFKNPQIVLVQVEDA